MIDQKELNTYLTQLFKPELFEDYAPNGLQIEGKPKIKRIAGAVSASYEAIAEALAWKADALIVHHGLFWRHQGAKPVTGPYGARLKTAIKADLNLWAYHLPLDAHLEVGNAKTLADKMKLKKIQPFGPYKKQYLGVQGVLTKSLTAEALRQELSSILHHQVRLASPSPQAKIKTIGIITGGAHNEWPNALSSGLDAYLTGEISEYNWHDAIEAGIHFYAGGHHATERFGIQALLKKLHQQFKVETRFFDSANLA